MKEPFDKEFAEQLQATDQPVTVDPTLLTQDLLIVRKRKARFRRNVVGFGATASLLTLLLAFAYFNFQAEDHEQIALDAPTENVANAIEDSSSIQNSTDIATDTEQLSLPAMLGIASAADAEKKIRVLKQEIEALNDLHSKQQRSLIRAELSRTEVSFQSLAAFQF